MEDRKLKAKEPGKPSVAMKSREERTAHESAVEEEAIVEMDECIWKELPEDLLESVVLRVPIATLTRFRLVCQKWNSMPFLQRCVPPELPWLYAVVQVDVSYKEFGALYDPLVKKWHYSTHPPPYGLWFSKQASRGGLVCYLDFIFDPEFHNPSFRVINHLTRTSKAFPWPVTTRVGLCIENFAVGLVDYPSGYKMIWLERVGKYGVYEYDYSSDKCTTKQGRLPVDIKLPCPLSASGLAIGSVVYFLRCDPGGILSYDTMSGAWEQHLIPHPPNSLDVTLAEGEMGRILLIGWIPHPCLSVCVWKLDAQKCSWIEVDRMPSSYLSEYRDGTVFFKCLCTRRLLMISLHGKRLRPSTSGICKYDCVSTFGVFTYDVVSREWSKLPDCIPPGRTVPQRVYDGIGFFPCLSASPSTGAPTPALQATPVADPKLRPYPNLDSRSRRARPRSSPPPPVRTCPRIPGPSPPSLAQPLALALSPAGSVPSLAQRRIRTTITLPGNPSPHPPLDTIIRHRRRRPAPSAAPPQPETTALTPWR